MLVLIHAFFVFIAVSRRDLLVLANTHRCGALLRVVIDAASLGQSSQAIQRAAPIYLPRYCVPRVVFPDRCATAREALRLLLVSRPAHCTAQKKGALCCNAPWFSESVHIRLRQLPESFHLPPTISTITRAR
jgi:hypothetical protein